MLDEEGEDETLSDRNKRNATYLIDDYVIERYKCHKIELGLDKNGIGQRLSDRKIEMAHYLIEDYL